MRIAAFTALQTQIFIFTTSTRFVGGVVTLISRVSFFTLATTTKRAGFPLHLPRLPAYLKVLR
ncbi:hypothetical protein [Klebsiella pneumoniae]|uniref:hypothetical protein n=1 Tax=Klebsiella pneumoniae TaxID=573 RepID=UPI000F60C5B5|nr:hypothetical protein [Klebsiella pneumoniae]